MVFRVHPAFVTLKVCQTGLKEVILPFSKSLEETMFSYSQLHNHWGAHTEAEVKRQDESIKRGLKALHVISHSVRKET